MEQIQPISCFPNWLAPQPDFDSEQLPPDAFHLFTRRGRSFMVALSTNLFFEISHAARAMLAEGIYDLSTAADLRHLGRMGVFAEPARRARAKAGGIASVTLNVSQVCNLACTYCFAQQGSYGQSQRYMPAEIADQALDFLAAQPVKRRNIVLFGGEPLLNFPLVTHILTQATERFGRDGVSFDLFLNGTVLTEEMVRTLRSYDTRLMLSIDGPADYQDHFRKYPDGRGSFAVIQSKLPMLAPWFPDRIVARATVTKATPRIDRVAEALMDMGFRHITIEPVVDDPTSPYAFGEGDLPLLKESVDQLADLLRATRGNGAQVSVIHDPLTRVVRPTPPKPTRCNAGTGYAALSTDGRFYPCHYFVGCDQWQLGDLQSGLDQSRAEALVAFGNQGLLGCKDCWVSGLCGGPCYFKAATFDGRDHLDTVECAFRRYTYEVAVDYISSLYPEGAYPQAAGWPQPPCAEEISHAVSAD